MFLFLRGHARPISQAALLDILAAVDRSDMGRVSVEIRSADPELPPVRVDPLPQQFARNPSLRAGCAIGADEVGRKAMAIAAAAAAAMP